MIPAEHWPDDEVPLGAEDLGADVDWMTWEHERLVTMATHGLDVPRAQAAAASWSAIGDELRDIADALARVVPAWQGPSAEQARRASAGLAGWTADAARRAHETGACVRRQADAAQRASREMPDPVEMLELPPSMYEPRSSSSPFIGSGFADAPRVTQSPWESVAEARAAHRHAADVMRRLQRESFDVYRSVPWSPAPSAPPPEQPQPQRAVVQEPEDDDLDDVDDEGSIFDKLLGR